jgi:hypothetical protein
MNKSSTFDIDLSSFSLLSAERGHSHSTDLSPVGRVAAIVVPGLPGRHAPLQRAVMTPWHTVV